jgi:hypothetical protein
MRRRGYQTEAQLRAIERRKREDEAPRLKNIISGVTMIRLEIDETQDDAPVLAARHTRHIVVEHAPALFEFLCTDPNCKEGGHDLTCEILRQLRSSAEHFEGEDACPGLTGTAPCRRVLRYTAHATFGPALSKGAVSR